MSLEQPGCNRRTVLKGLALGAAACVARETPSDAAGYGEGSRSGRLPRTSLAAAGIDPAAVMRFVNAVEQKVGGLHSFMLLKDGKVAAEAWWAPYGPEHPHMLFSLSKSFTSTAVGLAVGEGRLTVDAPVVSFFSADLPPAVSDNLKAMRVRHLLSMATGHDKDATGGTTAAADGNWVRAFLSLPVEHEPGSKFVYNSAATYMCSAIVQKLTGKTVLEYLTPRLFRPLGIEGMTWDTCPKGINVGGWGLNVKTEDIARFGQLYLQKGQWGGKQLVPAAWVAEATSKQISNGSSPESDWAQGYGYQFWRCRHGAYRGDGAFGQYCVVMPDRQAVLAITSGVGDMQAVLNAVWDHLLPGMAPGRVPGAHDREVRVGLEEALGELEVHAPEGKKTSPTAARVSGKTYRLETNAEGLVSLTPTFEKGRGVLVTRSAAGEQRLECGASRWIRGVEREPRALFANAAEETKLAARGAWIDDNTYVATVCLYETPFVRTTTYRFDGDKVTVERKTNVGFGPTTRPTLTGRLG
jgi:CubicO group peptidase (beta-lactamase class C family)